MLRKLSQPGPTNLLPTQFADPVGKLFESDIYRDSQSSHQWFHYLTSRHGIKLMMVNVVTVLCCVLHIIHPVSIVIQK